MSKVRIYGDTSGYVDIAVPAVAGTRTLNLDKVPQTDTSGNTGIGTDNPFTRAVVGDGTGTEVLTIFSGSTGEGQLRFADSDQGTGAYQGRVEYDHNAGKLNLGAGGATPVTIDSSGNVGIGTNSPGQNLHVSSADHTRVLITGGTDKYAELHWENDAQKFGMGVQNDNKFFLYNSTGGSQVLTVDTSSNVGINTQSPGSRKLKIVGSSSAYPLALDSTDTDYALEFQKNGVSEWWLKASASNFKIHENGVGDHFSIATGGDLTVSSSITATTTVNVGTGGGYYLKQDNSESTIRSESQPIVLQTYASGAWQDRVTIANDGNVGIGCTPESTVKLEVNAGADGAVAISGRSDGGNGNNRRFNLIPYADGGGANYGGGLKIQTRDDVNVFHDRITVQSNGNVDLGISQATTSVRINSNARTNTGLNVGGASSTATGIYVDNSDGGATFDLAVLGSSYGSHGASAGEVWFYSPDNINIGGATSSTNEVRILGSGGIRHNFYNTGYTGDPTDAGTFHFKGKGGNQLSILTAAYTAGAGTSIGTSNVQVVNSAFGALVFVAGYGNGQFCDLVYFGYNASPTIIAQQTIVGSPPSRIYTGSGYALYLRYSSGSLTTKVNCIQSHS